jgi:hypothetical protein
VSLVDEGVAIPARRLCDLGISGARLNDALAPVAFARDRLNTPCIKSFTMGWTMSEVGLEDIGRAKLAPKPAPGPRASEMRVRRRCKLVSYSCSTSNSSIGGSKSKNTVSWQCFCLLLGSHFRGSGLPGGGMSSCLSVGNNSCQSSRQVKCTALLRSLPTRSAPTVSAGGVICLCRASQARSCMMCCSRSSAVENVSLHLGHLCTHSSWW